jgi:pumilio family protein 6
VHSLISKDEASESATVNLESKLDAVADKEQGGSDDKEHVVSADTLVASDSKKDPFQRRHELLMKSDLAETLIKTCVENVGELLRTNFGKDVLYEVAVGGKDNVLEGITEQIHLLHDAIASDAARPKSEDIEHAFENFHSSRVIRKMILDCPAFAATLWEKALEGKCKLYADGYSSKVVAAYLESSDSKVKDLAKSELQLLVDGGKLKIPDHKAAEKK